MATQTKAELEAEVEELRAQIESGSEDFPDEDYTKGTIFELLPKVKAAIGAVKKVRSQGLKYEFRGIDGVVNAASAALIKYGITAVPETISHETFDQQVGQKVATLVKVLVSYRFYASDGTFIVATVPGESRDYADKGTAQAMSVAYRIALLQTFTLPTEEKDPELTSIERDVPNRVEQSIQKATGAAPASPGSLQGQIKALAGTKGMSSNSINEFARNATGTTEDAVWFNDTTHLAKVLEEMRKLPNKEA